MIYFITARELNRVKIGYSAEPRSRFVKMRTDSPVPLKLERVCDGEFPDERALHVRFRAWHRGGEWFDLSAEIEAHMDGLAAVQSPEWRRESKIAGLMDGIGCSFSYAAKMLSGHRPITLPIAISVYRIAGEKIGPLSDASDLEIDILEKFCGTFKQRPAPESEAA